MVYSEMERQIQFANRGKKSNEAAGVLGWKKQLSSELVSSIPQAVGG
jgi:hypothetical protein